MNETGDYFQQGDVLIKPVARIPEGAKPSPAGRVLREGEATGHAHVAVDAEVKLYIVGDRLFMDAPTGTEIVHEEHKTVAVPPGTYEISGVREYDHFAEEARAVLD